MTNSQPNERESSGDPQAANGWASVNRWASDLAPEDLPLLDSLARIMGEKALRRLGTIRLPEGFLLSVVIPVFNEQHTIEKLLRRVAASPIPKQILVIDDGSSDGTREVIDGLQDELGLEVILHKSNRGKGAALRTGFAQARGDVVITQDADLEYDPAEYARLIGPIVDGRADVVYGSRFRGEAARIHLFWHRVANGALTTLSNALTNLNLTDMETGYKAFRRSALEGIDIRQKRFGVEPELTAKIARRRCRVYEVAISYYGRDYSEGKKIGFRDALEAFYCIIRYAIAD